MSPLAPQEPLEPVRRPSLWALWHHRSSWSLWEGLHFEPFGITGALGAFEKAFILSPLEPQELLEPVRRPSSWALWYHRSSWSLWEGLHYEPFGTTGALGACEKAFIMSPLVPQKLLEPVRRPSWWVLWHHRSSWRFWECLHHEPFGTTEALGGCEKAFITSPLAPLCFCPQENNWGLKQHKP